MKRKLATFVMAVVVGLTSISFSTDSAKAEETPQEYVVMTEDTTAYEEVVEEYEGEIVAEEEVIGEEAQSQGFLEEENMVVLELTESEVEELEDNADVLFVEEDIIFEASFEEEQLEEYKEEEVFDASSEQWNLDAIHWNEKQVGGETVRVALLDSGVMYHDDIDVAADIRLVPGDEEINSMYMDPMGHGTGIASIIAGKINGEGIDGINPNAEIYSIQILNDSNQSSLSRVVSGIYKAIEEDCKIINMSFGTTVYSDILYKAICDAYDAGILMIAAAGNNPGAVEYPAAFPEVMAVGAITADGTWMKGTANGEEIEILAPGDQIITDGPWDGLYVNAGTSLSAAHVTGAASLLWAKNSDKPADYIRKLLVSTAQAVDNEEISAGILDVENAIEEMYNYAESYEKNPVVRSEYQNVTDETESFETEGLVNGSYSGTAHAQMAEYASEADELSISAANVAIMCLAAKQADKTEEKCLEEYGYKAGCRDVSRIHGMGNYVKTLKFLYTYAAGLKNGSARSVASAEAAELVGMTSEKEREVVQATLNFPDECTSKKKKYYYLMGIAIHLIGDTYAHVSMVPESAISLVGDEWFLKESSTCEMCNSDSLIKEWALKNKRKDLNIARCGHRKAYKRAIKLGVMATNDVKKFVKKSKEDDANDEFTDSIDYLNERYLKARRVCRRMLKRSEKDNVFDAVKIYISEDTDFSVKLNGLKTYMNDINCSIDIGNKNWDDFSTPNEV